MTESVNLPSVASVQCAFVPVCTRERFAQFSGLDEGVIRGMCDRGYLPTIKLGKYSLINLVALMQECQQAQAEITP
ncbi:MAG: hypothetical protein Q7S87_12835 [Agitococcus sp.]|nr:hypothetical protein [Agitococcus sp.]